MKPHSDRKLFAFELRSWISLCLGVGILAGSQGCSTIDPVELIFNQISKAHPDNIKVYRPEVVAYVGEPGKRVDYSLFSVAMPARGRWAYLKGADNCVLFVNKVSGPKPQVALIATCDSLRELPLPERKWDGAERVTVDDFIRVEELLIDSLEKAMTNGLASGGGIPFDFEGRFAVKSGLKQQSRVMTPYRLRSKRIIPDARFSPTGINFEAVFEPVPNSTTISRNPTMISSGHLFTPTWSNRSFIRIDIVKFEYPGAKNSDLEKAAEEFLAGFKPGK